MHYTTFLLLALAASTKLGAAQPIKRDPGLASILSHPGVSTGLACVSGLTWTASAACSVAAAANPAAAPALTVAANGLNTIAGVTATGAAMGSIKSAFGKKPTPESDSESRTAGTNPSPSTTPVPAAKAPKAAPKKANSLP